VCTIDAKVAYVIHPSRLMPSSNASASRIEPEPWLYRTPDQGLAATLHALGFSCVRGERHTDRDTVFVFQWCEDLDEAVARYWTDPLAVNARALVRALREIQLMAEAWARRESSDTS
jgi:Domain of unknown function (DUF5659)